MPSTPPATRRPAVLYMRDMEPVTVLDLQGAVWDRLANGERVDLPVVTRPESAPMLLLRSEFLPGQRPAVAHERRQAFAMGVLDALRLIDRG